MWTPDGETTTAWGFQPPQEPIKDLLNDYGDDIEERVNTADPCQDEEEIPKLVCRGDVALIGKLLAANHVPKTNGTEGYKAEIKRVQVAPALGCGIHQGGAA